MGDIKIHHDVIAEKLDEMADLSECWKRNRDKGIHPNAIRAAMVMLSHEIIAFAKIQDNETDDLLSRACGPIAYQDIHST